MTWATIARDVRDGRKVIVKTTDYDAHLEADGLRALAAAGAPVPEVIDVRADRLVMEEVSGPEAWDELGRALARCHRATDDGYGYHMDNVLGPLAQDNSPGATWPDFYAKRRLMPYLDDLPGDLASRMGTAIDSGAVGRLLEHGQTPSLVHGDLWSGNIVDGCWLIDPAVHYADRELDAAFAAVFGGIPAAMWRAYVEVWPWDDGWEERRPALQLYHLLVHVRLFGGSYVAMVADRLDRLGW
ncbi:MAG TPA: fructosamine kinase family protein [Acidimicrobiia bacterium]|nr:fructosamine kinase family protein [Acidimicrobiia bacterium]